MHKVERVFIRDLQLGDVVDNGHCSVVEWVQLFANGRASVRTNHGLFATDQEAEVFRVTTGEMKC